MKRILGVLALIAGVVTLVWTAIAASSHEDETTLSLTTPTNDTAFVYTAPGVLDLVNDEVTIKLSAQGEEIHWGLASSRDVEAYIGEASALKVTGLSSWEALATEPVAGTAEADALIAERGTNKGFRIATSDLWLESGTGENEITWSMTPETEFSRSLIATTTSGVAPDMTLTWVRENNAINTVPFYTIGVLLLLIGAFLLLNDYQDREAMKKALAKRQNLKVRAVNHYPENDEEADAQRTVHRQSTAAALGAAIVPSSERAAEFRSRELADEDRIVLAAADEVDSPETAIIDDAPSESPASDEPVALMDAADDERVHAEESRESDPVVEEIVEADEPVDAEVTDADAVAEQNNDELYEADADVVVEENETNETQTPEDWRSMWDLSWETPKNKEGDNA